MSGGGAGPVSVTGRVRSDRRCGAEFPLDDGEPSECDGGSEVNFTYLLIYNIYNIYDIYTSRTTAAPTGVTAGRARTTASARRAWTTGPPRTGCGTGWGCGAGTGGGWIYWIQYLHTCVLLIVCRCGAEYPLPDNSGPTQCDPNSENFCCSKWGYCGGDGEHCGCPECVNYRDNK